MVFWHVPRPAHSFLFMNYRFPVSLVVTGLFTNGAVLRTLASLPLSFGMSFIPTLLPVERKDEKDEIFELPRFAIEKKP
jgi:hypothetical protein